MLRCGCSGCHYLYSNVLEYHLRRRILVTLGVTAHLLFFVSLQFSFTQIVLQCMLCVITFPNMHLFLYHCRVKLSLKTTAVLPGNKDATHKNPRTLQRLQGDLFLRDHFLVETFNFFPWLSGDLQKAECEHEATLMQSDSARTQHNTKTHD